ncbi:MAG: D-alanyl-D-alanine carboxypeptidase family protein [Acidimicrobiales bacterium]
MTQHAKQGTYGTRGKPVDESSMAGLSALSASSRKPIVGAIIVILIALFVILQLARGVPSASISLTSSSAPLTFPGSIPSLPWPANGEAALAISGVGTIGVHGGNQPQPTWSVAKLMTAYLVLKGHPLQPGASGPTLSVTPADVAIYNHDVAQGDSVVSVSAGETLTERQALEALLIPSGDNIAPILANWVAGSESAFVARMNAQAAALGMHNTHYADASGVNPATVSTATDQLKLLEFAWQVPALRHTTEMAQVTTLPSPSNCPTCIYNNDAMIGHYGFIGGKTGSATNGAFSFVAQKTIGGQLRTVFGSVMGQTASSTPALPMPPNANNPLSVIDQAEAAAYNLVNSVASFPLGKSFLPANTQLGTISVPWASSIKAVTSKPLTFYGYPGIHTSMTVRKSRLGTAVSAHQIVATLTVTAGTKTTTVNLLASSAIPSPSMTWKLTRL